MFAESMVFSFSGLTTLTVTLQLMVVESAPFTTDFWYVFNVTEKSMLGRSCYVKQYKQVN